MSTHCRTCGARPPSYDRLRRGLCRKCYQNRDRDARPVDRKPAAAQPEPLPPDPTEPTREYPGSEAKIVVLERRRVEGVNLWHPLDAPLPEQADRPVELPPGLGAAALAALRPRQPVLRRLSPQDEP